MGKTHDKVVARQVFETAMVCKHVVRFEPHGLAEVGNELLDEIASGISVSKRALELLDNPQQILVAVEA
ncbi:MAG TPA: hypothetical protein PLX34_20740 [Sedimentisphaerales bacterium]|jgi:hypothetical protein|nr:hypothetical protein [Sedimentisphaerales bacterium]HQN36210.1 hypothetical protein [Sedimentisphaerales bacterium]